MTDDYSRDRSTTGLLRVGASLTGELETRGDVDWIKVRLQAGKTYRIDLEGLPTRAGTLEDPNLLGVHDFRELLLPDTLDDDGGVSLNSRLFSARTGTAIITSPSAPGDTTQAPTNCWWRKSVRMIIRTAGSATYASRRRQAARSSCRATATVLR